MILRPSPLSSSLFTYHSQDRSLTTEASMLPKGFDLGRVYDDAIDEGFTIVSEKTGREVVFAKERLIKDAEGDIQAWEFKSVTPGFKGFRVLIFND